MAFDVSDDALAMFAIANLSRTDIFRCGGLQRQGLFPQQWGATSIRQVVDYWSDPTTCRTCAYRQTSRGKLGAADGSTVPLKGGTFAPVCHDDMPDGVVGWNLIKH